MRRSHALSIMRQALSFRSQSATWPSNGRSTMTVVAIIICIASLFSLPGCNDDSDSTGSSGQVCPSCSDGTTDTSFGPFVFNSAGDDSTARRFVSNCGFAVARGHNGGTGDTLQVAGCGGGVELVWSNTKFTAYRVSVGWTGQTDRGVKIGQTRSVVVSLDPRLASSSGQFQVTYGPDDVLQELIVGQNFRR